MAWPSQPFAQHPVNSSENPLPSTPVSAFSKPKRRKIEVACETCRSRKSRCDGARPKCGACMRRKNVGPVCNYTEIARRDQIFDESTDSLSTSPAHVPQTQEPSPRGNIRMRALSLHSSVNDRSPRTVPERSPQRHTIGDSSNSHSNVPQTRESTPSEDGQGMDEHDVTGQNDSWIVKAGLLGASNSASFIRSICRAVGRVETPKTKVKDVPSASTSHQAPDHAMSNPISPRATTSHSADYVLPPRKRADQLLAMHWERSHIPWIDRTRMIHWYEGLWLGRDDMNRDIDEQIYYCTLNVVFAISYIDIDSPELDSAESKHLSRTHFDRAQRLLSFNLLNISYIGLLQALLVMIQYFQSTNMIRQCFQCTGLAILIAQNLGLHLPQTTSQITSQHDREMARRAWHGCILVDRITSMIYSQPMRISQEIARNSTLPAAIDDEYLEDGENGGTQPSDLPSRLQFFRVFCKLHIILGDILSTFYANRSATSRESSSEGCTALAGPDIDRIVHFDKALNDWLDSVDHHLCLGPGSQVVNPEFKGQTLNLHARFLHIRLLLYRIFLSEKTSELLDPQQPMKHSSFRQVPSLADTIGLQGLLTCVRTAQQLLQLLFSNIDEAQPAKQVPPWWHVISYVYSGVTVLVAAHLFSFVLEQIPADSLNASIQQGFRILEHYVTNEKPAQRCKAALTVLYEKMILASDVPKETPNGTIIPPDLGPTNTDGHGLDFDGNALPDFTWTDIIGSSELFSGGDDLYWSYSAPFDHQSMGA